MISQPPPPAWESTPPPPLTPPPPSSQPPGWYADPWGEGNWRWYDGHAWSAHVDRPGPVIHPLSSAPDALVTTEAVSEKKPRLPSFLSIPVALAAVPSLALLVFAAVTNPITIALGAVPLLIVAPVLVWMDRVEPEPWASRLHTLLWGAFVAGIISLVFNTVFALVTSETAAAVVSAPFIEELTKAGAILWMVRRREVDGIMDGLVYAGWAGLGFAVVEDVSYFYLADEQDILWETFVGRALLTPFAHPLFTAWTGLAIGLAVRNRASIMTAWWGLLLAMGSHAAWNGSLSVAEEEGGAIVAGVAVIAFIVLFLVTILGVILLRRRDQRRFVELVPTLAERYGVPIGDVSTMVTAKSRRQERRQLTSKRARRSFDEQASAIARLAALLDKPGAPAPAHEARLMSQLAADRSEGTI